MMLEKKENSIWIAGTGHRPQKLPGGFKSIDENMAKMKNVIQEYIYSLDDDKDLVIISGMALGWDTALAQIAIRNEIPLVCAIPCKGQESKWPREARETYSQILEKAAHVEYLYDYFQPWVMQKRNEWMVDRCDVLLACCSDDGSKSGTLNCVKYAQKKEVEIVNVYTKCGWT